MLTSSSEVATAAPGGSTANDMSSIRQATSERSAGQSLLICTRNRAWPPISTARMRGARSGIFVT